VKKKDLDKLAQQLGADTPTQADLDQLASVARVPDASKQSFDIPTATINTQPGGTRFFTEAINSLVTQAVQFQRVDAWEEFQVFLTLIDPGPVAVAPRINIWVNDILIYAEGLSGFGFNSLQPGFRYHSPTPIYEIRFQNQMADTVYVTYSISRANSRIRPMPSRISTYWPPLENRFEQNPFEAHVVGFGATPGVVVRAATPGQRAFITDLLVVNAAAVVTLVDWFLSTSPIPIWIHGAKAGECGAQHSFGIGYPRVIPATVILQANVAQPAAAAWEILARGYTIP